MKDFIVGLLILSALFIGCGFGSLTAWTMLKDDLHIGYKEGVTSGQRMEWQRLKDLYINEGESAIIKDFRIENTRQTQISGGC